MIEQDDINQIISWPISAPGHVTVFFNDGSFACSCGEVGD